MRIRFSPNAAPAQRNSSARRQLSFAILSTGLGESDNGASPDCVRHRAVRTGKAARMARIAQLEDNVFVAAQLTADDFADIAARGIRTIVNNRPDGEADDQLPSEEAEVAALRYGLVYRHLPVTNHDVTEDEPVAAQAKALRDLPGPVLFYCRSGNRSTILWAQASAARLGTDTVLQRAAQAGYQLEELREFIDDHAASIAA
jgi:uncharacterized protein (TIGR01244 family)